MTALTLSAKFIAMLAAWPVAAVVMLSAAYWMRFDSPIWVGL